MLKTEYFYYFLVYQYVNYIIIRGFGVLGFWGFGVGTDSHTPNAGGLGMIAIGVGGADAVDVMAGLPWEVKAPKIIGVKLPAPLGMEPRKRRDPQLAGILTVKGGTGAIIEYYGPGCATISCTGKGTICNMGAELARRPPFFPTTQIWTTTWRHWPRGNGRYGNDIKELCSQFPKFKAPPYYDKIIEINLSELEPYINGPYSPDKAWKISELKRLS